MEKPDKNTIQYIRHVSDELSPAEWKALADITHEAFREREEQGIHMKPNCLSEEGLRHWLSHDKIIIVAYAENTPIGYIAGCIEPGYNGCKQIYLFVVAVLPAYKRRGIGKGLFQKIEETARELGCAYLGSDTSCQALSSIAWHEQCGYEKWSYFHHKHTNYYSIRLRKYLDKSKRPGVRWWYYFKRWLRTHLRWTAKGNITPLVRLRWHLAGKRNSDPSVGKPLSLPQVQSVSMDLLKAFISFCEKHQLRYMLYYGTLIGAVRHQGFIPWDDDIDVSMPLPDYEKFIRLFECNNTSDHYHLMYGTRAGAATSYAVLVDNRTLCINRMRDREHTRPLGIDIFPAFPLADDETEARRQIDASVDAALGTWACHDVYRPNILRYLYRILFNDRILERHLQRVNEETYRYPWGSTRRLRVLSLEERELLALPADCFDTCVELPFEDIQAKVPAQYHAILTENYGDYMQIPPEEVRNRWLGHFRWISDDPMPEPRVDKTQNEHPPTP